MNERYQQTRTDNRNLPYDEWQRRMGPIDQSRDVEWQRPPYYGQEHQPRQEAWGRDPMRGDFGRVQQDGGSDWMGSQGRPFEVQGEWVPQQGRAYPRQTPWMQQARPFDQQGEWIPQQSWFAPQGQWAQPGVAIAQRWPQPTGRWPSELDRWSQMQSVQMPDRMQSVQMPDRMQSVQLPDLMQNGQMTEIRQGARMTQPGGVQPGTLLRQHPSWDEQQVMRGSQRGRGPRTYQRSDERIREDLCDVLLQDHYIDATDIEVVVSRGEVTLTGKVADRWEKFRAENISANVAGVRDVTNQLKIEEMGRSDGERDPTTNAGRSSSKSSRTSAGG